ncbi:MAG: ABC transporter permease [Anaerolineaceae bacterium]|nr:ABC transporter permease [Anaerolineaceae bacterium]
MKSPNKNSKSSTTEEWDMVISPRKKWYDLQLAEVWNYRDLIGMFVRRDFVSRYKQTILGPLWFLLQPLMTSLVFQVVFGNIAQLPTDGLPQLLFYMSGTVMWSYFSSCLNGTSQTFIGNAQLLGKVYFPRLVLPISVVISNMINFAIQLLFFLVLVGVFLFRGAEIRFTAWAFTLPLLVLLMAGLGLGLGIIVSSLTTKYRDLQNLVSFGVNLLMYLTPVIYPVSSIPQQWRFLADWNPVTPIIETFRMGFLGAGDTSWARLGYSAIFTVVILFIGIVIFNRVEKTFIDTV